MRRLRGFHSSPVTGGLFLGPRLGSRNRIRIARQRVSGCLIYAADRSTRSPPTSIPIPTLTLTGSLGLRLTLAAALLLNNFFDTFCAAAFGSLDDFALGICIGIAIGIGIGNGICICVKNGKPFLATSVARW